MENVIAIPDRDNVSALRGKIGWLCQIIRWLIVTWLVWQLYYNFAPLLMQSPSVTAAEWAKYWELPEGSVTVSEVYLNRFVLFITWSAAAILGAAVWKLMSGYLDGDILSATAAQRLRWVGLTGLVAAATDIIVRPIMLGILSTDIWKKVYWLDWVEPRDLLYVLISLFLLSFAYIQGTAAAITDEHKQFL